MFSLWDKQFPTHVGFQSPHPAATTILWRRTAGGGAGRGEEHLWVLEDVGQPWSKVFLWQMRWPRTWTQAFSHFLCHMTILEERFVRLVWKRCCETQLSGKVEALDGWGQGIIRGQYSDDKHCAHYPHGPSIPSWCLCLSQDLAM